MLPLAALQGCFHDYFAALTAKQERQPLPEIPIDRPTASKMRSFTLLLTVMACLGCASCVAGAEGRRPALLLPEAARLHCAAGRLQLRTVGATCATARQLAAKSSRSPPSCRSGRTAARPAGKRDFQALPGCLLCRRRRLGPAAASPVVRCHRHAPIQLQQVLLRGLGTAAHGSGSPTWGAYNTTATAPRPCFFRWKLKVRAPLPRV